MKANTRIFLHENINRQKLDWADYREDFFTHRTMSFEDFKEYLITNGYGRIDLKYINLSNDRAKPVQVNLDVELFTRDDYNWLTTFEWGMMKYVDIVAVDKRMIAA